jgi:hypothetical protein
MSSISQNFDQKNSGHKKRKVAIPNRNERLRSGNKNKHPQISERTHGAMSLPMKLRTDCGNRKLELERNRSHPLPVKLLLGFK